VLEVGKRYENPRSGTSIEIVERTPESMTFERSYAPNTGRADPHYHLDFTQTWETVKGAGEIEVDGETRPVAESQRIDIEPGTPHRDPYLRGEGELVVRGTFTPCGDFIEGYAEAWAHHLTEGTTNRQDEMPLMQILAIAKETDGQSYRAGIPRFIQSASLPLIAAIARLRGYRTSYE
jgi:mannose-6-phosphate isomerase-like protein (cupin superfamily)